ncbi:MAG: hypothetical protein ACI4E1_06655, partial [Lachnospira sp.]
YQGKFPILEKREVSIRIYTFKTTINRIGGGTIAGVINRIYIKSDVDMLYLQFGNIILYCLASCLLSYCTIVSVECLYEKGYQLKLIEELGRSSMLIMALHLILFKYMRLLLLQVGIESAYIVFGVVIVLTSVIAVLIRYYAKWMYIFPWCRG